MSQTTSMMAALLSLGCQSEGMLSTEPPPGLDMAAPDPCMAGSKNATEPAPDTSFLSSGGAKQNLTVPRETTFTIGTTLPATIYYTLDGSEPRSSCTTQFGPSPLSLLVGPADATLKWFADFGAQYMPEVTSDAAVDIDTGQPRTDMGSLVENVKFSKSSGPVVTAAPGEVLSGTLNYQVWRSNSSGYCPGCIIQFVVVLGTPAGGTIVSNGCDPNVTSAGTYPGKNRSMNFSLTAPQTPGIYLLQQGLTLQASCNGSKPPSRVDIGQVIVK